MDQLMHMPNKDNVHIHRTGLFKSRTVEVNGQECKVDQLITALGERIKNASQEEPNLEKLKQMLTAVSTAEKEHRGFTTSLFHLFSNRDHAFSDLDRTITGKITEHSLIEAFKGAVDINRDDPAPFSKLMKMLHGSHLSKQVKDNIMETTTVYLSTNPNEPFSWRKLSDVDVPVQFYIKREGSAGSDPKYSVLVKDETGTRLTQDVIDWINKKDIEI